MIAEEQKTSLNVHLFTGNAEFKVFKLIINYQYESQLSVVAHFPCLNIY